MTLWVECQRVIWWFIHLIANMKLILSVCRLQIVIEMSMQCRYLKIS